MPALKVRGEEGEESEGSWRTHSRDPSTSRSLNSPITDPIFEDMKEEAEGEKPIECTDVKDVKDVLPGDVYQRFTGLNTRMLRYQEEELVALQDSLNHLDGLPKLTPQLFEQRTHLLATVTWKLQMYNSSLISFSAVKALPDHRTSDADLLTLIPKPPQAPQQIPPSDPSPTPELKQAPATPEPVKSRWTPPSPSPLALQVITILAILLAPYLKDLLAAGPVEEGAEAMWRWEVVALRACMWVLALAAAVVEVVKGKGWFAFCVLVVGLGCVLGLLAGS